MALKKFFTQKNLAQVLDDKKTGFGNFYFDLFLIGLILFSSFIFVLETYFTTGTFSVVLKGIDYVIMSFFTLEFFVRNYFATNKKKTFFSAYNLIDVFAILPFWFVSGVSLQFLRVFRILKLFRFLSKYFDKKYLSRARANQITLLKMFSILFILLFVSSSLIYTFESASNDKINNFSDAVYLSLVTVTTVGFGDIVPVTQNGRFVVMVIIMFGIFLIPVYIGSLLKAYMKTAKKRDVTCTHCGLKKHDHNATHCKMCGEIIYQEFEG